MCCDDFISKQNSEKLEKLQKRSLNSKSFHEYYLRSRYVFHLNNKPCNVFVTFHCPEAIDSIFLGQFFCLANQGLTYFIKINEDISTLLLLLFE